MRDRRRMGVGPDAKEWAASFVGTDARIVAVRRLIGGTASVVHRLTIEDAGRRHHVVLRRWLTDREPEAPTWVRQEASVLRQLGGTDLPAPELVGYDESGARCDGCPSILMTHLPGRIELSPRDPAQWLARMADLLPRIHSLPFVAPPHDPWLEQPLSVPRWSSHPQAWQTAIDLVGQEHPAESWFIHRDFQHFNILWSRGTVSGIVDWTFASMGPPEADVGHCRLNLAILFSVEKAERFLAAYESAAGRKIDAYWDVVALLAYLPGWGSGIQVQAGRRAVVDIKGMHGRVDALMSKAVRRL